MGKIIGFILILALGFGSGWFARSYRATSACQNAGGVFDTNRGLCTGAPAAGAVLTVPPVETVPPTAMVPPTGQ